MQLFLIQHGRAKSKDEDPDRPLTEEGSRETEAVARFLQGRVRPHLIHHSGKTRARETAEILDRVLGADGGVAESDGLSPMDDPALWSDRLRSEEKSLVLTGHLPHMSRLAARLLCGDAGREVVTFRNSGVLCLERTDDSWSLRWHVVPELVR